MQHTDFKVLYHFNDLWLQNLHSYNWRKDVLSIGYDEKSLIIDPTLTLQVNRMHRYKSLIYMFVEFYKNIYWLVKNSLFQP